MDENNKEQPIQIYGTPDERLTTINEAIYAVLKGGQSYQIGTRRIQRADLAQLYSMQKQAQAETLGEAKSALFTDCVVGVFDGR